MVAHLFPYLASLVDDLILLRSEGPLLHPPARAGCTTDAAGRTCPIVLKPTCLSLKGCECHGSERVAVTSRRRRGSTDL
ncbi:hypothetical protein ACFX1T_047033 [Malus domestica]